MDRRRYVIPADGLDDCVRADMSKSERLKALLGAGYFPEELPPSFTTVDFAKYRRSIGVAWAALQNYPN